MLGLLFPERCGLCDRYLGVDELGACENCASQLTGIRVPPCPHGGARHAAGLYGGGLPEAIQRLKFHGQRWRGRSLGLACELPDGFDVLVPVPLHPRRLRTRGYNQAMIIARGLARRNGLPVRARLLHRLCYRAPQAGRDSDTRGDIAGDFHSRACPDLRVLVIDDVTTTGHTFAACRRALLLAGATRVEGFAIAYTPRLGPLDGDDAA